MASRVKVGRKSFDSIIEIRRGCGGLVGARASCLLGSREVVERWHGRVVRERVRVDAGGVVHRSWLAIRLIVMK